MGRLNDIQVSALPQTENMFCHWWEARRTFLSKPPYYGEFSVPLGLIFWITHYWRSSSFQTHCILVTWDLLILLSLSLDLMLPWSISEVTRAFSPCFYVRQYRMVIGRADLACLCLNSSFIIYQVCDLGNLLDSSDSISLLFLSIRKTKGIHLTRLMLIKNLKQCLSHSIKWASITLQEKVYFLDW